MGLFSIFKKKPEADAPVPLRRDSIDSTRLPRDLEAERARQRDIARATAAKIDAIEYAMTFEIFNDAPAAVAPAPAPAAADAGDAALDTTLLLPDDGAAAIVQAQPSPAAEEAAILFANGQGEAAEQVLRAALAGDGAHQRQLWAMLFDLLQLAGRQADFEQLAADYAERLATSPPSWLAPAATPAPARRLALAGAIDAAAVAALGALDGDAAVLLDTAAVHSITPDGCQALLALLERLRRQQAPLAIDAIEALHGALARAIAFDPKAAPAWLLQLELLQRCANEAAFEDAAMAYCAAFDMSPPSYVAPAPADTILGALPDDGRLHLPPELPADAAFAVQLARHATEHGELVFDALSLQRAGYAATTALLSQLGPLHAGGLAIAFLDLNHLVAALFQLIGLEQVAKLHTRKY